MIGGRRILRRLGISGRRRLPLSIAAALGVIAVACNAPPPPTSPSPPPASPPNRNELRVFSVLPVAGKSTEETFITIRGTGFHSGATVTFDGLDRPATVTSDETIDITAPLHPPGGVDIVVRNPDGRSIRLERVFTYVEDLNKEGTITIRPGDSITATIGHDNDWCTGESVPCRFVIVQAPADVTIELELVSLDGRPRVGVYEAEPFVAPAYYPKSLTVPGGRRVWVGGEYALFGLTARIRD